MLTTRHEILERLASLGIAASTVDHPPVFTVEEARRHVHGLPGGHCKNLFLKDKKDRLWLVTCLDDRVVDLNGLSKKLGAARFSFGKADLLKAVLGVEPGSVTPLAIVNDEDQRVTHVLDSKLLAHEDVNCHPLQNDATTTLASADLLRFIRSTGHEPVIVDLDEA
ncbi:MAG: prolyl-tRNA synthetase associated domain-containing protein [Geminicoccaceae bacterium]